MDENLGTCLEESYFHESEDCKGNYEALGVSFSDNSSSSQGADESFNNEDNSPVSFLIQDRSIKVNYIESQDKPFSSLNCHVPSLRP